MRSRYSAFAVGDAGYLLRTWHPSGRPQKLSLDPALRWTRLAVLETRDGGLFDTTGTVQFRVKRKLKKIQCRPHLMDGCLAGTGPTIEPW
jgi:uncharacterized protein YchJ